MKIAHIVSTFPPYSGGMGNACFYEVQELAKLGHEVTVFTPQYISESRIQNLESRIEIIYLKPILKLGNAAFVPQVTKFLKDFDIIHLHWPFIGGAEAILIWKILQRFLRKSASSPRKSALVVQYQMDLVDRGWRGLFFNFYSLIFTPFLVRAADKILVSSFDYARHSKLKRYLAKFSEKFVEIPLGVDTERFYPQPKDTGLLEKYEIKPDEKIILFVGGLDRAHWFKGIEVLLRAVANLQFSISNFQLIIIGGGDLRPKYEKMAEDLGIGEKVIFAGKVPDDDLPKYYNLADIFVLPSISRSEAFGLVVLEAMACAKPVIVSDLPGPRTLVSDNGLKVKIGDVNHLSDRLLMLLRNKELAQKFGANGREKVLEQYNWPKVVEKLVKVYAQHIE